MPKIKTKKSIKKRLHFSGSGKLLSRKMSITHRSRFKSKRAKLNSSKMVTFSPTVTKKLRKVLGK